MRPITTVARPLVAAPYIVTGLETLRDPRRRAEQVGPAVKPVADRVEWLPKDPETLVRIEGAISLGTGMLLMSGRFGRMTALLLAAQLVPALATEHRYWTEDDPERRASERSHLLKNASLLGALLMVATEPRRSARAAEIQRAVKQARTRAGAETRAVRREKAAEMRNVRREAARQVRDARRRGTLGATTASTLASRTAARAGTAAKIGKTAGMAKAAGIAKGAGKGKRKTKGKGIASFLGIGGRKPRRGRAAVSAMAPMARVAMAARPAGTKVAGAGAKAGAKAAGAGAKAGTKATAAGTKAATAVKERSGQAAKAMKH
jgi:uncharacterized membrane protein YphA (DoxX/SURF4 family)